MHLINDPSIPINADGRTILVTPYRLGMPLLPPLRRDAQGMMHPYPPGMLPHPFPPGHPLALANGVPVSMQHQIMKMQPPTAAPQMRISSNGGMRPPGMQLSGQQTNGPPHHVSPPHPLPVPVPQHATPNGVNGSVALPSACPMLMCRRLRPSLHLPSRTVSLLYLSQKAIPTPLLMAYQPVRSRKT